MSLKSFKIPLVTCMTSTKPVMAEQVDQCPFILVESVEAVSSSKLHELANNFTPKESQFEPTEKFQARLESSVKNSIPSLAIQPTEVHRDELRYMRTRNIFYTDYFLSDETIFLDELIAEFFNVEEESGSYLRRIHHEVFSERNVTGDFILVPEMSYNDTTVYGDHVIDYCDIYKRRNGKSYSVER